MQINFFLKDAKRTKTSVFAIIRYKGNRFKVTTGISVEVKYWDKSTHRARITRDYPDHDVVNIQLDDFELKVKKVFTDAAKSGTIPTDDDLKQATQIKAAPKPVISHFLPYFVNYYQTHGYKTGALKNYTKTANFIKAYETQFRQQLTFDDINIQFYANFKNWFLALPKPQSKKEKEAAEPTEYYSLNYFGAQVKQIKTVMREAGVEGDKIHASTDYKNRKFVKDTEEADTVYLSTAELAKIQQLPLTYETTAEHYPKLTPKLIELKLIALRKTRSFFLIGCYTALRISDFSRLEHYNIGDSYIRIKPKKGIKKNDDVVIPIHPVISGILASGFDLSHKMSDQRFNEHLKELCQLSGICELITTVRTEGGRQVSRTAEKWTLVASHTCRRSGATNMAMAGIPLISIMKITGHSTEKSLLRYIRISQEENARLLAQHPFFKVAPHITENELQ